MSYRMKRGWFTNVNGIDVIKRSVGLGSTSYTAGYPKAVLWHYTAGCGGDLSSVLKVRGISVTFSIDRDGTIYQYLPFSKAGWHAFSMSHFAVGIEHSALPGTCELTKIQLGASARLSAAILEHVKRKYAFEIPLRKLAPPVTLGNVVPGFFDHRDGDDSWNENGHTDHLYGQTWGEYLKAVSNVLLPPTTYEVGAVKGDVTKERTFGELSKAWAWARELLKKGFRIKVRPKGPPAGEL